MDLAIKIYINVFIMIKSISRHLEDIEWLRGTTGNLDGYRRIWRDFGIKRDIVGFGMDIDRFGGILGLRGIKGDLWCISTDFRNIGTLKVLSRWTLYPFITSPLNLPISSYITFNPSTSILILRYHLHILISPIYSQIHRFIWYSKIF